MKILFVNFIKFWGGGESWTYQVMDELRKRNHNVVLLSNSESKLLSKSKIGHFETHSFPINKASFLNFSQQAKIRQELIDIKPDVIILNSSLELKTIGLTIKDCGCSKVIFTRGIPFRIKMNPLKRYLLSNVVTDVVVNSNYVKNSILNLEKYLKNPPVVIYHGIDPDTLLKAIGNTKKIAIVGRLSEEKGIDIAIELMPNILQLHPDAELWIMGDGKEKQKLENLTSKLGIQQSVKFWGFVTDVEKLLLQCSMLIMTSRWEGFGLVLLEAMKLQIPCLAFDHIAANEIIINNETGYLIPDMSIDLMSEKINYLLSNPDFARQMGQKGNERLRSNFTIDESINQYEKIMSKL